MCVSLQEHRLQTADQAAELYRKREKKAAPAGWEAFNNKTLFKAYERRTEDMHVDLEVRVFVFTPDSRPGLLKRGRHEPALSLEECAVTGI